MRIEKVLVVEDDPLMKAFVMEVIKRKRWEVTSCDTGRKAIELLSKETFDLVLSDIRLPDESGIEVLRKAKETFTHTIVILTTAYASVESAVEAMRLGAFNYLIKPFPPETLETVIEKAQEHGALIQENEILRNEVSLKNAMERRQMIAASPIMRQIIDNVAKIAKSNASVFISGESGTGKEVIASAIHYGSLRKDKPFIRVNCAAIPHTLLESEFFGHEKGAFTGAISRRVGRFELADKGTLLLDEISEIPLEIQPKLLRAIQEQEFERVGGNKIIKVDTRFISTSNRNMKDTIEKKMFREDLYYRLNVVPVHLPPLRERKEDILPLAEFFLEKICQENHKSLKKLSDHAKKRLLEYPWPGNIRELANVIERSVVMNIDNLIEPGDLLIDISCPVPQNSTFPFQDNMTLAEVEKNHIINMLKNLQNNKTKTAEHLGISIRTLRNKLKEYSVENI
ncbi:MAG: sigma-54-dependent Fis family transcriptional regulator [Chlamydiae bacterium]|nr:sigma-54-dependent Fis family transcriptional regulator [Chlamydiota bacterium]